MAKKNRNRLITASFHYLVKSLPAEDEGQERIEAGFSEQEFDRVLHRISDVNPLNDADEGVIARIKGGKDLPFLHFEECERHLYFGDFEGAYYGSRYRNNRLGAIDPESLNLRRFHYLIAFLRDGKILIGVTYHGQFGDYDGIQSCLTHLLEGNYRVASKTIRSISGEIGAGQPVSLSLTYRKRAGRPERKPLFGSSGVLAIRNTDFGDDFEVKVVEAANQIRGTDAQRKRVIAEIVNQGEMLELDSEDILGCSAIVREDGRTRTVYFIGENNFATKFLLDVNMDQNGDVERERVKSEMIRVMRDNIINLLA